MKMRKTWSHNDIKHLLNLWNDFEKELKALKRNSHIYDKIAALLRSRGVDATSSEVHFKINNLKQRYRKDELYGLTSWRYFEDVKEILKENRGCSQNCMKSENNLSVFNDYTRTITKNDFSMDQSTNDMKNCNSSPIYELSPSNSLSSLIPSVSVSNCIMPPTIPSNPIPPQNSYSNVIPSSHTILPPPIQSRETNSLCNNTTVPPRSSQDNFIPPPTSTASHVPTVVIPNSQRRCSPPPQSPRAPSGKWKKRSFKRALLDEIRRGNDIAAKEQEATQRLLKQANEINLEWNRMMKEFMDRGLAILEKHLTVPEKTD